MSTQPPFPVRLFYSYCHKDERFRKSMEKALALLRRKNIIRDWSDHNILPGQGISAAIRKEMEESDIFAFLLSPEFIASEECMKEWEMAKRLPTNGRIRFRVPIVLSPCAWQDMLSEDDVKALPKDGQPISSHVQEESAWLEVYEGVRTVAEAVRTNFAVRTDFFASIKKTELVSQDYIDLDDIFVFSSLSRFSPDSATSIQLTEERITSTSQLLASGDCFIHGDDMSGKTALSRHLFMHLVNRSEPVLFVDLKEMHGLPSDGNLQHVYEREFNGDYNVWKDQSNKTVILDNLSSAPNAIRFLAFVKDIFERVIVTATSDVYRSFFRDDVRIADFKVLSIDALTHGQQETLIRKRLAMIGHASVTDGFVDQVEGRVNAVIDNNIVPRYPFYVLSVLQTYEGFMPSNLSITSYGHCYYVWILARLIKAGIAKRDEDINVCLNFAEQLAFRIYRRREEDGEEFTRADFDAFVEEYRSSYIMRASILNRLMDREYGILSDEGRFRVPYMHYFFLGLFLSKGGPDQKKIVERLCERSYTSANHLTLLFVIHHAADNEVLETILLMTMCTLDSVEPATLTSHETARFRQIVAELPSRVLSNDDVPKERQRVRKLRDLGEDNATTGADDSGREELYRSCQ